MPQKIEDVIKDLLKHRHDLEMGLIEAIRIIVYEQKEEYKTIKDVGEFGAPGCYSPFIKSWPYVASFVRKFIEANIDYQFVIEDVSKGAYDGSH